MVKLSLLAAKGNVARYFPHQGFLALTPIRLEGHVRTRLDDDRKPIQASDIFVAVRCYEARITRTGVSHTNLIVDHRLTVWSKPDDVAWGPIGDGDWPFRLVLPPKLAGHSTAHFQEYRVFWRIEAVLNHIPTFGVGHRQIKTYDLPLLRYDAGEALPPAPTAWALAHYSAKHAAGAPALRYVISTPALPLGPTDLVPVAIKLLPADPQARVAGLSLMVERRLEFNDLPPADDTSLASTTNLLERPAPRAPAKAATFALASAETTDVPRDEHGVYAKTVTLQIPTQKSSSHWAVGETMRTALVTLRFFLHVKVTLAHGQQGAETVGLAPREVCVVATNESQRRVALAKHAEYAERRKAAKAGRRPHTSGGVASPRAKGAGRRARHSASADREREDETARGVAAAAAAATGGGPGWEEEGSEGVHSAPARKGAFSREGTPENGAPLAEEWEEELERIATQSRRRSVAMLFGERRTRARIEA